MKRGLFSDDHEAFRETVTKFVQREVAPNLEKWDEQRLIDRDLWHAAAAQGIIGLTAPAEFGGAGVGYDYRFRVVVLEELAKVYATSVSAAFSVQDDMIVPYVVSLGTSEQQKRWLPKLVSGELVGAIAMTEPGTGSDLRGIRTSAVKVDGGWRVNGAKTFISSGIQADIIITVVRTDPAGTGSFSLLVVERDMPGFSRGRKLHKMGINGHDTAELFFEDVFVPDENLLGAEGGGFTQLMHHLPLERLSIAAAAIAASGPAIATTVDYVQGRTAFGQSVADFQNTRFRLADLVTEFEVTRAYVDKATLAYAAGELTAVEAAKAKLWSTEVQGRIMDECVQLHGGYGFMTEYPITRAYQDARAQRIYGGTSEIMRHIIGRDIVGRR
jgi:long-chain-acyl-CoA dehydrogenase